MYKIIFTMITALIFMSNLYSQNIFDEFSNIYNGDGKQIKVIGSITDIKNGIKDKEPFEMIKSMNYTLLYFTAKNTKSLFLANNQGYFIQGKNQRSALKVAGSYTVTGAANTSDVMSFDFKKDYAVDNIINANEVLLKRIRRDVAYNQALLKKESFGYTINFMDNSGKSVKKGVYTIGNISGSKEKGVTTMEFYNLIINTNMITVYKTTKLLPVNVSDSFFRSENMGKLFTLFEN